MGKYSHLVPRKTLNFQKPGMNVEIDNPGVSVVWKHTTGEEHRQFVAAYESHPEKLMSWDSNGTLSLDEYIKKVKAGDYD